MNFTMPAPQCSKNHTNSLLLILRHQKRIQVTKTHPTPPSKIIITIPRRPIFPTRADNPTIRPRSCRQQQACANIAALDLHVDFAAADVLQDVYDGALLVRPDAAIGVFARVEYTGSELDALGGCLWEEGADEV